MKQMCFTKKTIRALRKQYDAALAEGARVFEFNGQTFLTDYAKYMLEYLENWLDKEVKK